MSRRMPHRRRRSGMAALPSAKVLVAGLSVVLGLSLLFVTMRAPSAARDPGAVLSLDGPQARLNARVLQYCNAASNIGGSNGALHAGSDLASAMGGSLSLRYVHVFARHGTRTSVHSVPNVNHPGPCEPAQFSVDDLRAFQLQQVDDTTFKARVDSMRAQLQGPHPPNVEKMDVVATSLENTGLLGPNAAPLPSSTAEGCKGGLLTAEGVAQHRSLGSFFRRVYVDETGFLPTTLDPDTIRVDSTDYSRTILSAAAQVLGLYPRDTWAEAVAAGPFPIHVRPRSVDEALFVAQRFADVQCPRGAEAMAFNRARVAAHRNPTLASRLAKIAGVDVEELPSPVHIADMMYSRLCRDEELPCWGSKCLDRRTAVALLHEADWEYHTRFHNRTVGESAMPLVGRVIQGATRRVSGSNGPLFQLSTMHDITIAPVLSALGAFDNMWPPLASHIAFEVWGPPETAHSGRDLEEARVRVVFNGQDVTPRTFCYDASAHSDMCRWADFVKLVTPVREWVESCA